MAYYDIVYQVVLKKNASRPSFGRGGGRCRTPWATIRAEALADSEPGSISGEAMPSRTLIVARQNAPAPSEAY